MNKKCGYWRCSHRVGLFLAILFVACFVWFYINPVEQDLHLRNLRLAFLGFSGLNFSSFLLGLLQAYIWAYIGVGIWSVVGCCLKPGADKE
ncbi:MAG: hypothetical protein Q8P20_01470 [bacterium]|nr:hypothetical protein [bacterium]